jgi:hypothetical protein
VKGGNEHLLQVSNHLAIFWFENLQSSCHDLLVSDKIQSALNVIDDFFVTIKTGRNERVLSQNLRRNSHVVLSWSDQICIMNSKWRDLWRKTWEYFCLSRNQKTFKRQHMGGVFCTGSPLSYHKSLHVIALEKVMFLQSECGAGHYPKKSILFAAKVI